MSFTYEQSTGALTQDGESIATGYSGNGAALNNWTMQNVRMHGPIPQGFYTIGAPQVHEQLGPVTMSLMPDPANEMFGRSGFFMHGDNAAMNRTGSDGCIVLDHATRVLVGAAVLGGDNRLRVTA